MQHWCKELWLDFVNRVNSLNQEECFISAKHSYATKNLLMTWAPGRKTRDELTKIETKAYSYHFLLSRRKLPIADVLVRAEEVLRTRWNATSCRQSSGRRQTEPGPAWPRCSWGCCRCPRRGHPRPLPERRKKWLIDHLPQPPKNWS